MGSTKRNALMVFAIVFWVSQVALCTVEGVRYYTNGKVRPDFKVPF